MRINKLEAVGIAVSVGLMVVALWLVRVESTTELLTSTGDNQLAAPVTIGKSDDQARANLEAVTSAVDENGDLKRLIIDDVIIGGGQEAKVGDTVTVHYVGRLQNGQEFDNSNKRGEPFTFTLGDGKVIAGWEQGVVGMKVGGERILVIPPDLAYGKSGFGPIPGDATLVFSIKLLSIE